MDEELASIALVSFSVGDDYNPALRIICQKNKKRVKVSSAPNGHSKVMDAVNIPKVNVLNKLSISEYSSFVHHITNECYKGYTLSKTLEEIQVGGKVEDVNMEVDHTDNMP